MIKINIYLLNLNSWIIMILIMFIIILNYLSPIFINIMLIFYSMLICLNLSLWKSNFLYSIMLFLMMISGMLIIFLYFSSIISNEQLKIFINPLYFLLLIFLFMIMNYLLYNFFMKMIFHNFFNEINSIYLMNKFMFNNIMYMYKFPFNFKSIMCMIYLILTLSIIIKICLINSFPLRKIK